MNGNGLRFPRHERHAVTEGFDDRVCLALDRENIGLGAVHWVHELARCACQGTTPIPAGSLAPGMVVVFPKGERATVTRTSQHAPSGDRVWDAVTDTGRTFRGCGPAWGSWLTVEHRPAGNTGEVIPKRQRRRQRGW